MQRGGENDRCKQSRARGRGATRARLAVAVLTTTVATVLLWPHGGSATPAAPGGVGLRLASTPWPAFMLSPGHFGAAPARGPQSASVRWRVKLEGDVTPGPVVGARGVAYVATNAGELHAIEVASGVQLWTFSGGGKYGSDLSTSPAILDDGTVLWPGPRHSLFAVDPAGRELWRLQLRDDLLSPLVDGRRGRLYLSDQSGLVRAYALQAADPDTGEPPEPRLLWHLELHSQTLGSPALAPDGTIYETAGNNVLAITPSGRIRWRFAAGGLIEVSPAVAQDGTVVVGSNDSMEYGITPRGRARWTYAINEYTYSSPQTLPGGRVAFGDHLGRVNLLDARTGRVIRRFQGRGQVWTSALLDGAGDLYFATRHGDVYGFSDSGRRLFDYRLPTTFDSYPALAADGTLIIGDDSGELLALAGSRRPAA